MSKPVQDKFISDFILTCTTLANECRKGKVKQGALLDIMCEIENILYPVAEDPDDYDQSPGDVLGYYDERNCEAPKC